MGNIAPVKNMKIKRGKLPIIRTCVTDLENAAMKRLKAIMETVVNTITKKTGMNAL
jgi:hypothetical protein